MTTSTKSEDVEALVRRYNLYGWDVYGWDMAADTLSALCAERDALQEEVNRLREAVKYIAESDNMYEPCGWAINTARHALTASTEEKGDG